MREIQLATVSPHTIVLSTDAKNYRHRSLQFTTQIPPQTTDLSSTAATRRTVGAQELCSKSTACTCGAVGTQAHTNSSQPNQLTFRIYDTTAQTSRENQVPGSFRMTSPSRADGAVSAGCFTQTCVIKQMSRFKAVSCMAYTLQVP